MTDDSLKGFAITGRVCNEIGKVLFMWKQSRDTSAYKSYIITEFNRKRAAVSWKLGFVVGLVHSFLLIKV